MDLNPNGNWPIGRRAERPAGKIDREAVRFTERKSGRPVIFHSSDLMIINYANRRVTKPQIADRHEVASNGFLE